MLFASLADYFGQYRKKRSVKGTKPAKRAAARRRGISLLVERLEDRTVPAAYLVGTSADADSLPSTGGTGTAADPFQIATLRSAIGLAKLNAEADTITFAAGLTGTITLTLGQLTIADDLTITGPGASNLAISGNNTSRVFNVDDGSAATVRTVVIDGLTMTQGSATAGSGGGILNNENLTVRNSTLSGNTAFGLGGGVRNVGTVTLQNSTLSGNSATTAGGGLSTSGMATLQNSTLSGNSANIGGGLTTSGTTTIQNSTLSGNSAGNNGGGLYNTTGTVTLQNSTLSGNTATTGGGGLFNNSGTATLQNSTLSGNSAGLTGGGLYHNSGTTTLQNSIVSGNTAPTGAEVAHRGPGFGQVIANANDLFGHSGLTQAQAFSKFAPGATDITATSGGTTGILKPTALAAILDTTLRNNGGPTQTHALVASSPALNAGDNSLVPAGVDFDQRGAPFVRKLGVVDIGAFEALTLVVDTLADENDGNYAAGDLSLREAIALANATPGADSITFAQALSGGTITLSASLGELAITDALTISGAGLPLAPIISGNGVTRVFDINASGFSCTLDTLVITRGMANASTTPFNSQGANLLLQSGTLTITNCAITGGTASTFGGGIRAFSPATLQILNSTISGNTAGADSAGGGIDTDATTVLTNCTISGNTNTNGGGSAAGGLWLSGSVTLQNTIIAGNTATNPDIFIRTSPSPGSLTATHSLIGSATGNGLPNNVDGNRVGVSPLLGNLQNNGGATPTMALLNNSQAINAGDNSLVPAGLIFDQRGAPFSRKVGTVDMGAFEVQPTQLIVDTLVDENDGNYNTGDLSLREAIALANAVPGVDTITFVQALSGGTITLTLGQLNITDDVTITGLGANKLAVSGNPDPTLASRVFNVDDGTGTVRTVVIDGLTITQGRATGGSGGGILNLENLTVRNSTLSGNFTTGNGGGLHNSGGTVTLQNSTLSGNSAGNVGGGLDNNNGTATLQNSTLSGNSANFGGGIRNRDRGSLTVQNSTLTGNTAFVKGGGLYNEGAATLQNTLIAGNTAFADIAPGHEINLTAGTITANANNLFGHSGLTQAQAFVNFTPGALDINASSGGTTGIRKPTALSGILDTTLRNNGGPTLTHALVAGSPALNAGNAGLLPNGTTNDQRGAGFPRVVGTGLDIGAFEAQSRVVGSNEAKLVYPTSYVKLAGGKVQGAFTITNLSSKAINGPITLTFAKLPPGVSVASVTSLPSLGAKKAGKITVVFNNPNNVSLSNLQLLFPATIQAT